MNFIKTLALAAMPAIALASCGGGSHTPNSALVPQTDDSMQSAVVTPYDTTSNDLHAGGATFPGLAYNGAVQPVGTYSSTQPLPSTSSMFSTSRYGGTANVYYCLTGSGAGRAFFTTGSKTSGTSTIYDTGACAALGLSPTGAGARKDPMDFAGSDVALTPAEYTTYVSNRQTKYGAAFEFPSIAGPIVFPYRAPDFTSNIRLSRWSYCAIANGTISNWNDAAITADNGASVTGGVSRPITFYFRSDGSGTTANFTNHLATVCQSSSWTGKYAAAPYQSTGRSANWTYGGNAANWPGPGSSAVPNARFIGESGNPGVIAAIQGKAYATGYAEGAYAAAAARPNLKQASLLNKAGIFVSPTIKNDITATFANISYVTGQGTGGAITNSTRPDCLFYINQSEFVNPAASDAYPIGAVSYLMFYGAGNGTHLTNLRKLISYVASSSSTTLISSLEYAPIPSTIQSVISHAANTGTSAHPSSPCINI